MKNIIISVSLIIAIFATVLVLSIYLGKTLFKLEEAVKNYEITNKDNLSEVKKDFTVYYQSFRKYLIFLSFLMPDDILSEIENGYLDIISYSQAGSYESVLASKARLANDLENSRKMTTVGLMSVF